MKIEDGSMDDWDDEGFSMPFSEEDDGPPTEGAMGNIEVEKVLVEPSGEHGIVMVAFVTKLG